MAYNHSLLAEFGGHSNLSRHWAYHLLHGMNFVRRKAKTSRNKYTPADFSKSKTSFLHDLVTIIKSITQYWNDLTHPKVDSGNAKKWMDIIRDIRSSEDLRVTDHDKLVHVCGKWNYGVSCHITACCFHNRPKIHLVPVSAWTMNVVLTEKRLQVATMALLLQGMGQMQEELTMVH